MTEIYEVYHCFDVDGGFGDAVYEESKVATFESKEDAETFVEKFKNPHVYDSPYADLNCGSLYVRKAKVISKGTDLDVIAFKRLEMSDFDLKEKMDIVFLFEYYPVLFKDGKAVALTRDWISFIIKQAKEVGTNLEYEFVDNNFERYEKKILEAVNNYENLDEVLYVLKGE